MKHSNQKSIWFTLMQWKSKQPFIIDRFYWIFDTDTYIIWESKIWYKFFFITKYKVIEEMCFEQHIL